METSEAVSAGRGCSTRDGVRTEVHAMWASVAGGWAEHAEYADRRGAAVAAAMLDRTAVAPGDVVLDLACGPGGAGLAAARRTGPSGRVVLTDVAPPMVATALARAAAEGLANVEGRVRDIEDLDEADAAYDVVLCREGLMLAIDPVRAAREMLRVLRPGGRLAVAVWGPRGDNPWLGAVLDAVSAHLGRPVPPPGAPGPFSLAGGGDLAAVLSRAGLVDVVVEPCAVPLHAASPAEWWARTVALAGPLAAILGRLTPPDEEALRARAHAAAAPWSTADGGLAFPGVALVASGRRAGAG